MLPLLLALVPTAGAYALEGARWWCEDLPLVLTPGSTEASAAAARGAEPWTAHRPELSVALATVDRPRGHARDGVSTVTFDDPDDVLGTGVLAATVLYRGAENDTVDGYTVERLEEADVVFNDGVLWDDCQGYQRTWVAEHELGHVFGLGHSAEPDALMRASTPRCTEAQGLSDDERDGVDRLYPAAGFLDLALEINPPGGDAPLVAELALVGSGTLTGVGWDFGDGPTGSGNPTSHTWRAPGEYRVVALADGEACAAALEATVVVEDGGGPDLPGDSVHDDDTAPQPHDSPPPGEDKPARCGSAPGPASPLWLPLALLARRRRISPRRRPPG